MSFIPFAPLKLLRCPALTRSYPRHFTFHVAHLIRSIETRSCPPLSRRYPRGFAFYVAFPKAPFDLSVLPIYVARVPAAPFTRSCPRHFAPAAAGSLIPFAPFGRCNGKRTNSRPTRPPLQLKSGDCGPVTGAKQRPGFSSALPIQVDSTLLDELTHALPTLSPSRACPSMSPDPCSAPFLPVFLHS